MFGIDDPLMGFESTRIPTSQIGSSDRSNKTCDSTWIGLISNRWVKSGLTLYIIRAHDSVHGFCIRRT